MANFSGTINLLGFKGAKVFTNLDAQHPSQLYGAIEHIGSVVTRDGFYVRHYYRKVPGFID